MRLDRLQLKDFRNIAEASLAFSPGLNLILGPNGQGKSNLLEAIGLLATGRSFRQAPPKEMVRRGGADQSRPDQGGADFFLLNGEIDAGGLARKLDFFGQATRQTARLDGKALPALSGLGRTLAAVLFIPDSTRELIRAGPGERRRYLDWRVFARAREHAAAVRDFQQAVKARNRLLQQGKSGDELAPWEGEIARLGAPIAHQRRLKAERLEAAQRPFLQALGLDPARFGSRYASQLDRHFPSGWTVAEAEGAYRDLLRESRGRDRRGGRTSIGPHRDDLAFRMDGAPVGTLGSQGQQKRFVLALKLAEAVLLKEAVGEPPLFVLDDPASELDGAGADLLMGTLAAEGSQVFLSACAEDGLPWPGDSKRIFRVQDGAFHL